MIGCLVCSAYVSALAVGAMPLIAYDSYEKKSYQGQSSRGRGTLLAVRRSVAGPCVSFIVLCGHLFYYQGMHQGTVEDRQTPWAPCTTREGLKLAISMNPLLSPVEPLKVDYDRERLEDIGYMTCMTLVLLGNYAQTGHFGGPLAYTPYNVALHLAGPELGGLRYDYRRPKHPFCDKFMLAGGHNIPTCVCPVDDHGGSPGTQARQHWRCALSCGPARSPSCPLMRWVFAAVPAPEDSAARPWAWTTIRSLPRRNCVAFGPWPAMPKRRM